MTRRHEEPGTTAIHPSLAAPPPRSGRDPAAAGANASQLALLAAAQLLAMTLWFSATAVLPSLQAAWRLGASQSAWLTAAVQLGFVAGALASALFNLPDVLPPRRMFALAALGGAACTLALAFAVDSIGPALALRFMTGVFLAGVYPPGMKIAAGHASSARRGLAIGVLVGALTLGSATPHLIAALAGEGLPYRAVLATAGALAVIGAGLVALAVRDGPFASPAAPFDPHQIGRVLRNRPLLLANLGYLGHMWELYAMWAWLAVFLAAAMPDAGPAAPRLGAFAIIGAAGGAGAVAGGWLADRVGRTTVTIGAMALSGACCLASAVFYAAPAWALVAFGLVWGAAVVADSAQFSAATSELADPAYIGTALGLQTSLGFALTLVTIWALPLLAAETGWRFAFIALAPGPLLGCWAMAALRRHPESLRLAAGRR